MDEDEDTTWGSGGNTTFGSIASTPRITMVDFSDLTPGNTDELLRQLATPETPAELSSQERLAGDTDSFRRAMNMEESGATGDQASPHTPIGMRRNRRGQETPYQSPYDRSATQPIAPGFTMVSPGDISTPETRAAPQPFTLSDEEFPPVDVWNSGYTSDDNSSINARWETLPTSSPARAPYYDESRYPETQEAFASTSSASAAAAGEELPLNYQVRTEQPEFDMFSAYADAPMPFVQESDARDVFQFLDQLQDDEKVSMRTEQPAVESFAAAAAAAAVPKERRVGRLPHLTAAESRYIEDNLNRLADTNLRTKCTTNRTQKMSKRQYERVYPADLEQPPEDRLARRVVPFAFFPRSLYAFTGRAALSLESLDRLESEWQRNNYDGKVDHVGSRASSDDVYDTYMISIVAWIIESFDDHLIPTALRQLFVTYSFTLTAYKALGVGMWDFLQVNDRKVRAVVNHYVAIHLLNMYLKNTSNADEKTKNYQMWHVVCDFFQHAASIQEDAVDGFTIITVLETPYVHYALEEEMLRDGKSQYDFESKANKAFLFKEGQDIPQENLRRYFLLTALLEYATNIDILAQYQTSMALRYLCMTFSYSWSKLKEAAIKEFRFVGQTQLSIHLLRAILLFIKTGYCSPDEYALVNMPIKYNWRTEVYPDFFEANFRVLIRRKFLNEQQVSWLVDYINQPGLQRATFARRENQMFMRRLTKTKAQAVELKDRIAGVRMVRLPVPHQFGEQPLFEHDVWQSEVETFSGNYEPLCHAYPSNYVWDAFLNKGLELEQLLVRLEMLSQMPFSKIYRSGRVVFYPV